MKTRLAQQNPNLENDQEIKMQVVIRELKGRWERFVGLRKLVLKS
jgi:hypothetical protein